MTEMSAKSIQDDPVPGLVSVIIPTRDRAPMIRDSLQSVFQQRYRPIEVLVVDDGSVDETESIVADWALRVGGDGRMVVKYLKQKQAGAPAARNRGFAASRGEFIQYLDSDDLLHRDRFGAHLNMFRVDPEIDYVYSGAGTFGSGVDWGAKPEYGKPDSAALATHVGHASLNSVCGVYRRRICTAIGPWDEQLAKWQDWEYNVRLLACGAHCVSIPGVHALIRRHRSGQIADLSRTKGGLGAMAHAVTLAEATLLDRDRCDHAVREALAARWALVAAEAVRCGHPHFAMSAIKNGRRHASSGSRRLRLGVLRLLASLPPNLGSRACEMILAVAHARSRTVVDRHDRQLAKQRTASTAS